MPRPFLGTPDKAIEAIIRLDPATVAASKEAPGLARGGAARMGRAQSRQRPRVFRREDSAPLHPLSLSDAFEELYSKARGILDDAENDGQIALSLQAIAELRRTVELLAKLTGEIDERPAEGEARITQETGAMIANVFIAVFADNSLGLDFDTQHQGREVAARHLRAIASEDPQTS